MVRMNLGRQRGKMRNAGVWLLLAAIGIAGCEDEAKRPVQAHAPAPNPQPTQVAQGQRTQAGPSAVGSLPVRNLKTHPLISLTPQLPGGIPYLIEKVKEKFAAGE